MKVKFFDPHNEFTGPTIPLPRKIKALIDALDGMEIDLDEAVALIRATLLRYDIKAEVEISDKLTGQLGHGALLLWMPGKNAPPPKHLWRLIRFQVL